MMRTVLILLGGRWKLILQRTTSTWCKREEVQRQLSVFWTLHNSVLMMTVMTRIMMTMTDTKIWDKRLWFRFLFIKQHWTQTLFTTFFTGTTLTISSTDMSFVIFTVSELWLYTLWFVCDPGLKLVFWRHQVVENIYSSFLSFFFHFSLSYCPRANSKAVLH